MPVHIIREGLFELFESTKQHFILVLNGEAWYALVEGQQGRIIVHSDPDHKKRRTIQRGRFYFVNFEQDPRFTDMPRLFLEEEDRYREHMLPNGLPTESDPQKRIVVTDDTLGKEDLEQYLQHPESAGSGARRRETEGGRLGRAPELPIENYNELSVDEIVPRLDRMESGQIRQLRAYEHKHKDRRTLMQAYDRRLSGSK